jgi:hypothetical protein
MMLRGVLERLDRKHLERWLPAWLLDRARHRAARTRRAGAGPRHLLFSFCDHYEPLWGGASIETGRARVEAWRAGYPRLAARFRDADGRPPQHSFFFPGEQYDEVTLSMLAELARDGFGEVELHLHHDGDTAAKLRADVQDYLAKLAHHGHLSRDVDGRLRYAFIHGNWCLSNARRDGRWCGVDEELPLLFDTGCYADFTFPSAPDECQPAVVNQIYWPVGDLARRRAYEQSERARVGLRRDDRMLIVTGPIALTRRPRSLQPRIESAAVTAKDPGTAARVRSWVDQGICIEGRPEWIFVKVHTHGAIEREAASLLGEGGLAMHEALTTRYNDGQRWKLHYVTARETFNIAMAAMEGHSGDPGRFRDHVLAPPPVRAGHPG